MKASCMVDVSIQKNTQVNSKRNSPNGKVRLRNDNAMICLNYKNEHLRFNVVCGNSGCLRLISNGILKLKCLFSII